MTIEEAYNNFTEKLKTIYEAREARNIADWVFESEGIKRLDRITGKEKQLDNLTICQFDNILEELVQHKPVQYVLHEAWFYKMKFYVDENVLIPRPETEELVEWVVSDVRSTMYDVRCKNEEIRNNKLGIRNEKVSELTTHYSPLTTHNSQLTILDIGTGSGCIPIALKKELGDPEIISIDVSEGALKVARQNAETQNTKIEFIQLDFLNEKSWTSLPSFNIIISNPPYIPENEKGKLDKNVTSYEPHLALFVEDDDAFIFYKKIAVFAQTHLKKDGKIFVEVHEDYAKEVKGIFNQHNFHTEIKKDIYGRERMIMAFK